MCKFLQFGLLGQRQVDDILGNDIEVRRHEDVVVVVGSHGAVNVLRC